MKKILIAALVVGALVLSAVVDASALASASAPRAQLRNLVCQKALDPPARAVSVTAVMRPLSGTEKLEMKFGLFSRIPGTRAPTQLSGTGLGTWITPVQSTLGRRAGDVWIVHHPVADLSAPAVYRFRVVFRWLGAHGKVLGSARRTSRACRQPELRPDLLVQSFTAQAVPGHPMLDAYIARISNVGATGAGPFDVEFTDGAKAKSALITRLRAHTTRLLQFVGPVCNSTDPPSVTVDPQHQVDEYNVANDTATAVCPVG